MAGFETKFCSVHIGKIRVCNVRPKIYIILLLQIFSSLLRHSRKSAWEFCLPACAWCSAASSPRNRAWNEDSRRLREVLQSWSRPILRDCKTSHNLQQPSFQALPRTPTTAPTAGCCSRMTGRAAASCSVATRESAGTTRIFSATSTTAPGWPRLTTRVTLPFHHSTSPPHVTLTDQDWTTGWKQDFWRQLMLENMPPSGWEPPPMWASTHKLLHKIKSRYFYGSCNIFFLVPGPAQPAPAWHLVLAAHEHHGGVERLGGRGAQQLQRLHRAAPRGLPRHVGVPRPHHPLVPGLLLERCQLWWNSSLHLSEYLPKLKLCDTKLFSMHVNTHVWKI